MRKSRAVHQRAVQHVETFPQLVTAVRTWMVPLRVPDELRSPILVTGVCTIVVLGLLMASTFPDVSDEVSPIRVWGWMAPGILLGAGLGLSWSAMTNVGRKRLLDAFEALARAAMTLLLCLTTGLAGVAALLAASTGLADPPDWLDTSTNHALAWQIAAFAAVLTVGVFLMALGCRQTLVTSRLEARSFDTTVLSVVVAAVTLAWGTALFIAIAPAGVPAIGVLLTGLSLVAGALGRYAYLANRQRAESLRSLLTALERFETAHVRGLHPEIEDAALELGGSVHLRGAYGERLLPSSMRVAVSTLSGMAAGIVTWGDRPFDDFLRRTLSPLTSDQAAAVLAEAAALLRLRLGPLR